MKKNFILLYLFLCACACIQADVRTSISDLQNALLYTDYFYVDSVKTEKLAEDAIRGMLKGLDPHSTYLTSDEVKNMNEGLGGNFEGIGVRYQMEHDTLLIINTVVGGPSEKLGVLAGDRIIAVNDTAIAGVEMTNKEVQRRLRGPKGTLVKVTILREGEKIDFNIIRDKIPVYSVDAFYMATPTIGYIKVSRFALTTPSEVESAMKELTQKGMQSLIIDLQGNGGGYLESAVQLSSLFLNKNEMVVYTEGRREPRKNHYATRDDPFKGKLVVLIDEESASSSEIFTGAIQDWDRGVVVGRRSFGKGLVQRPIELPSGAMIRLTIAHYYTPSGRCIQKPYTKGENEDYRKDLLTRYRNGEFTSVDSIHLPDSLKFHTHGRRIVYGGGAIMPDVFVPLDTTKMTHSHRNLIAKGHFHRYVLDYFKEHQKKLHSTYKDFDEFDKGFEVSDKMVDDLCASAQKDSVKIVKEEIENSLSIIKMQLKANIATDLFEQGSFSRIMNRRSNTYKTAIDLLSDQKRYQSILEAE